MKRLATILAAAALLALPAAAQSPGPPQRPGLIQEQPNADTERPAPPSGDTGQKPWEPIVVPAVLVVGGIAYMVLSRRKR
ncbi:MAG TPA: hypothetical protein VGM37_06475 [Armatimonadota bacterium]|jgi:hypothetical protein